MKRDEFFKIIKQAIEAKTSRTVRKGYTVREWHAPVVVGGQGRPHLHSLINTGDSS